MKRILSAALAMLLLFTLTACGNGEVPADETVTDTRPVMDGKTLVVFGDSITALSTWPKAVAKELNMNLINSGIGANTTAHGIARFDRDVTAHNPDYVIMSFATNDFYRANVVDPQVSVEDYTQNLVTFVEKTRTAGATPILMTPPFISESASGGALRYPEGSVNAALDVYVEAMRTVASEQDVLLIDIHKVCDTQDQSTFLSADGVHLSDVGNDVYTDTICNVMREHFRNDPDAERVTDPTAPPAEQGTWTKSLIPMDIAQWNIIYPDTAEGESNDDGTISFWNTNGKWPEVHYSPLITDAITAPVKGTTLTVDLDLSTNGTNILLFFNGPTPTLAYDNTYVSLTSILKAADPTVKTSGDDLLAGQQIRMTIPLEDVVPSSYIADDGTVVFSGVKVFVIGAAYLPLTINELSITTA